jgi:hypothetical protein
MYLSGRFILKFDEFFISLFILKYFIYDYIRFFKNKTGTVYEYCRPVGKIRKITSK